MLLEPELIRDIIANIGDDPARPGLVDTPARVMRSWEELFAGYNYTDDEIADLLKTFEPGESSPVRVADIPFFSTCEHHMLPFYGTADIRYVPDPDQGVIGLSKIPRLVDAYARRLQVQERLTRQIAAALHPRTWAVEVRLTGRHLCLAARGRQARETTMTTVHRVNRSAHAAHRLQEEFPR